MMEIILTPILYILAAALALAGLNFYLKHVTLRERPEEFDDRSEVGRQLLNELDLGYFPELERERLGEVSLELLPRLAAEVRRLIRAANRPHVRLYLPLFYLLWGLTYLKARLWAGPDDLRPLIALELIACR